jgi:hypothetical protein
MYNKMKDKLKIAGKVIWILGILVIFQACYPGGSIPITDLDTVSTYYNTEDLSTPPTSAAIVWEVVEIIDEEDPDNNIPYKGEVDSEILNTTLLQLIDLYGKENVVIIADTTMEHLVPTPVDTTIPVFDPEEDPNPPAVQSLVAPSVLLRKEYVGVVYPGYPWWGGGWWGGWWGGCWYCYYPPTVSYQRFDVGSIRLDMFDLRQIPQGGEPPADFDPSWVALFRGLISSNSTTNSDRVVSSIQQAYEQSPYLKP